MLELAQKQISGEKNSQIYYTNSTEILQKYSVNHNQYELIHFKYSNKTRSYGEYILNLRNRNIRPDIINELIINSIKNRVNTLTDANLDRILDTGFPSVVVILPDFSNDNLLKELMNEMDTARRHFPSDLWYFVANYNQSNVKIFIDLLRITPEMLPTVIAFDGSAPKDSNEIRKYIWNRGDINAANLKLFIQDLYNNALQIYLASEDIPTQPRGENGVYKFVGKNFAETVVKSRGKEIMILICTNYVKGCFQTAILFENVGKNWLTMSVSN
jgi:hypothetical protein